MKLLVLTIFTSLFLTNVQAHNEDKPGPNGGYIRMPGAFHTEVVPEKAGAFRLYLLDVNIENPLATGPAPKAELVIGKQKTAFNCLVQKENYFECTPTTKVSLAKGQLHLTVQREKLSGEAQYQLPLSLDGNSMSMGTQKEHPHSK